MTAELPPPGDGDLAEWWAKALAGGVLYALITETEPISRGSGVAPATARIEFKVGTDQPTTHEQRFADILTARRVLTTRGFRRR